MQDKRGRDEHGNLLMERGRWRKVDGKGERKD